MRVLRQIRPTPEQLVILGDVGAGFRLIRGAAGSGKTTTALMRLRQLCSSRISRKARLGLSGPVRNLVLSFDPEILGHPGVVFATTNNIYPACKRAEGLAGFKRLFADQVHGRYDELHDRTNKRPEWPTDRQAEVLYPGELSCDHLQRIDVQVEATIDKVEGIKGGLNLDDVPVLYAPEVFE